MDEATGLPPPHADPVAISAHDDVPAGDAATVDAGLTAFNHAAAPLHEVRPLACFARDARGEVVGGALGRTWGDCAEIQELWVDETCRGARIGSRLVRSFEAAAAARGCRTFYLETLDFQAPRFYEKLGYRIVFTLDVLPHGVKRHTMLRRDEDPRR